MKRPTLGPTHIMRPDDRTFCGISLKDDACLPYVGAHAVQMHIAGRARAGVDPIVWCRACWPTAPPVDAR